MTGLDNVTTILNEYLEKFDLKTEPDTDFAYYYADNLITYAFVISERMDEMFWRAAHTIDPELKVDTFLLSLFHEIGHNETIDGLTDEENYISDTMKKEINSENETAETYFYAPDEYAATAWAVNYINDNKEEVMELWKKLQPAILNFYASNDIH